MKTEEEIKKRIEEIIIIPDNSTVYNAYSSGLKKALEWVLED